MTLEIKSISILFTACSTFTMMSYMTIQVNSFVAYERDANWTTEMEITDGQNKENTNKEIKYKTTAASNENYKTVDATHKVYNSPAKGNQRRGEKNHTISNKDVTTKMNEKASVEIDERKDENGKNKIKRQIQIQDGKSLDFGIKNKTVQDFIDVNNPDRMAYDQLTGNSAPTPLATRAPVVLTADSGSQPHSLITKSNGAQAISVYYEPPKDPQPENFGGPFTLHTDLVGGQVVSSPLKPPE